MHDLDAQLAMIVHVIGSHESAGERGRLWPRAVTFLLLWSVRVAVYGSDDYGHT